jgi:imidazolonepropionase
MNLACIVGHMTLPEALVAATLNAAAALGRSDVQGSLECGKMADMVVLDVPRYALFGELVSTNLKLCMFGVVPCSYVIFSC